MKQKRADTLQRYNQVLATLNGGLTDVTLLDERTPPDVLDHFISAGNALHGVGAKSSFMEHDLKTAIIEERNASRRQRSTACKRRDASRRPRGKMRLTVTLIVRVRVWLPNSVLEKLIRTNFDEVFEKFDAFLAALIFHKMMVARGLW